LLFALHSEPFSTSFFKLLLKNVIFPLLCYSKGDEELWAEDCEEFLRYKYDVYEV